MFARRTRILLLGAVITVALLGVILLQAPEPTRTVDEVMEGPSAYLEREIAMSVVKLSMAVSTYQPKATSMLHGFYVYVTASTTSMHQYQMALGDNRTVYAQGVLKYYLDGEYVFEAQMSSKHRALQSMKKKLTLYAPKVGFFVQIQSVVGLDRDRWGARRTLYHKSSSRWAESLWAAKAASWFLHADVDVSPPHDSGAVNCFRRETGNG